MMNNTHKARLRSDVQSFVNGQSQSGKPVAISSIQSHIISLGWNLVDSKMFAGWVSENISGNIDYGN
jgi:hypothetical protein